MPGVVRASRYGFDIITQNVENLEVNMTSFDHQANLKNISNLRKKQIIPAFLTILLFVGGTTSLLISGPFIMPTSVAWTIIAIYIAGIIAFSYYLSLEGKIVREQDKGAKVAQDEFFTRSAIIFNKHFQRKKT